MKRSILPIFLVLVLLSCKKDQTDGMICKMKYTVENISLNRTALDTTYTQFGNYITSITPFKFAANTWSLGYLDRVMVMGTNEANSLEYVNQQYGCPGCLKPENHPDRYIDFSGNAEVSIVPGIGGSVNADRNIFQANQVNFIYFYFIPYHLYQEFRLPAQYAGVNLDMFQPTGQDSAVRAGDTIKVRHREMIHKIYPNANLNQYVQFIFGNCDSTYVVNPNGEGVPHAENNPLMGNTESNLIIRSNLYKTMTLNAPDKNVVVELNGVLSFNTSGLIQVYAGADNIPYTSDDVFVYAPRFWERIKSRLDIL